MAAWSLKSCKPGSVCTTIYCKIIRFRLGSIFVEFMGTSQPLTKFCPHKHIELPQSMKFYPTNFNDSTVVCFATTGWELTSNNFCKQMAIIFFSIQKLSLVYGNTCKYPPSNLADIYCRTNFLIGNWNTQLRILQGSTTSIITDPGAWLLQVLEKSASLCHKEISQNCQHQLFFKSASSGIKTMSQRH